MTINQSNISALFGLALLFAFMFTFVAGFFRSPFVPSNRRTIEKMLKIAKIKKGEKVVDLGCGDGRIVVRADRLYGAKAVGYEISWMVWSLAQLNKLLKGSNAKIYRQSFFQADLSQVDVVFCYLLPEAMRQLEPKFKKELKKGARIVSASFSLPGWKPVRDYPREGRVVRIFVYKKT